MKGKNNFAVLTANQKRELKAKQDFVPFSFSASGSVRGPLVFAGYGVSADEFQYDDYAGIDVKDKIVLVCNPSRTAGAKACLAKELTINGKSWPLGGGPNATPPAATGARQ